MTGIGFPKPVRAPKAPRKPLRSRSPMKRGTALRAKRWGIAYKRPRRLSDPRQNDEARRDWTAHQQCIGVGRIPGHRCTGRIEDGFDVLRAWGYRYITAITWVKDKIGCGHYFRNTTEHMLFGVRGSLPLKVANLPTHFEAPRTKHSRKPERSFEIAEEASHGPYLELFARGETRPGWTSWGNQASGTTIQIAERPLTGAEFLAACAEAITPRTDEEIRELIADLSEGA